jgi:hypothetical protein
MNTHLTNIYEIYFQYFSVVNNKIHRQIYKSITGQNNGPYMNEVIQNKSGAQYQKKPL